MEILFSATIFVASISIIISVLMQNAKQQGLGVMDGSSNNYGKKGTSKDIFLGKITKIAFIIYLISAIALAIIK